MRFKLATKISLTIAGVVTLAVVSSVVAVFAARQSNRLMERMVTENLASVVAAQELQIALMEQRGFVTSYILDEGNRAWLDELERKEPAFQRWLAEVRATANTSKEQAVLADVEEVFNQYDAKRDEAVALYDKGEVEAAKRVVLRDVKTAYDQAYKLCEDYVAANQRIVQSRTALGRNQIRRLTYLVGGCVVLTICTGTGLVWVFFRGVLLPLRRMAAEVRSHTGTPNPKPGGTPKDELRTVGLLLRTLMTDVAETRSNLDRSRQQLMAAEKLATVGKLAACVAHEIRNPLTAVKMWLFSIRKDVGPNPELERKFDIIAEDIARLESIVWNFLQFSRPPELKLKTQSVALLMDKTLELMGHLIDEKQLRVLGNGTGELPPVLGDSEQLKQVFVNLLNNAAEAMREGGEIRIGTETTVQPDGQEMVVVRIQDSGPGMPSDVRERLFEPFFTTKDEGTGLGLCIAARIMERHGGRLVLESSTEHGTTFAVWIPANGASVCSST